MRQMVLPQLNREFGLSANPLYFLANVPTN